MAKGKHPQAKLVLCTQTGVFYDCIEDASEVINMKSGTLRAMLMVEILINQFYSCITYKIITLYQD